MLGGPDRPGANEKVHVGMIGCGGRAHDDRQDVPTCRQFRVVAACDCFLPRADEFRPRALGKDSKWNVYDDFRKMIEKEKLDGVMVETTTHARAWIVIQAMQAGIDAYIEKPMCLTIAEGRAMVKAARKYNRVTQVGTQQRSMPINNWASDLVKNGAIGKILTVHCPELRRPDRWTKTSVEGRQGAGASPGGTCGRTRPSCGRTIRDIHHGWGRWWDYDGGGLCFGVTGWGTHSYDQINRALGTDDTGPVEVLLEEPVADRETGKFAGRQTVGGVDPAATRGDIDTGTDYHGMAKLERPAGQGHHEVRQRHGTEAPSRRRPRPGPGGDLRRRERQDRDQPRQDRQQSEGDRPLAGQPRPQQAARNGVPHRELGRLHQEPQAAATPTSRSASGRRTLCYLVNIVRDVGRVGEPLKWDPAAERFTNCDEANKLLDRPRRKGYELPEIA